MFFKDLLLILLGVISTLILFGILVSVALIVVFVIAMFISGFVHLIKDTYRKGKL